MPGSPLERERPRLALQIHHLPEVSALARLSSVVCWVLSRKAVYRPLCPALHGAPDKSSRECEFSPSCVPGRLLPL